MFERGELEKMIFFSFFCKIISCCLKMKFIYARSTSIPFFKTTLLGVTFIAVNIIGE